MPDHGQRARYLRGCRCQDCRRANARYLKAYRQRTSPERGRPTRPVRVAAAPVREHLAALLASGWCWRHVEAESGVNRGTLSRLGRINQTVHRDVAARLLDLEPLAPVDLDPVVVDRLAHGADWRALSATRAERLAAYEAARRAGESGKSARRRLGLAGRDTASREAS